MDSEYCLFQNQGADELIFNEGSVTQLNTKTRYPKAWTFVSRAVRRSSQEFISPRTATVIYYFTYPSYGSKQTVNTATLENSQSQSISPLDSPLLSATAFLKTLGIGVALKRNKTAKQDPKFIKMSFSLDPTVT